MSKVRSYPITVEGIEVEVQRKKVKNLNLAVYPPDGRVRISVPMRTSKKAVRELLETRLPWIKRQQRKIRGKTKPRSFQYVTGEIHQCLGQRYRLVVIEHSGRPKAFLDGDSTLMLYVRPGNGREMRERLLREWYRDRLKELVPSLVAKWEPVVGVEVAEWRIKRMKTRWGTCNIQARRIWLNLELARRPVHCLEFIIVHEMVHLLERLHNKRFKAYMDRFMPDWRVYRDELNGRTDDSFWCST